MKTKVLSMALVLLCFTACTQEETNPVIEPNTTSEYEYTGSIEVTQSDSSIFTQPDVVAKISMENGKMNITMEGVKFAEAMPLTLTMEIPGVDYTTTEQTVFSGNNIVPLAMGGEFPAYTITNLTGSLNDNTIEFNMICGTNPVKYTGTTNN